MPILWQNGSLSMAKDLLSTVLLSYHANLRPALKLPNGVDWLFPYEDKAVMDILEIFLKTFYYDRHSRMLLLGINPGRFGAGITGIPFTDPIRLESACGIINSFQKKQELSSIFVYDIINALGGPEYFYKRFYISSICPLGFIKDGKNFNYYDSSELEQTVRPYMVAHIRNLIERIGVKTKKVFSIGQGKNYQYLVKLNQEHQFFDDVVPLPHPRWVMQYRLKRKAEFVQQYVNALKA
jgi:hypothetical protein